MSGRGGIDPAALAVLREAPAAVVADVLDRLGRREQALDGSIRPLWPEARAVGVAATIEIVADTREPEAPYDGELTFLDGLQPGELAVVAVEAGVRCASWGELFSCAALARGATGLVLDGLARDAAEMHELRFPVFARGCSPLDTYGRASVSALGSPVRVGGVEVSPGDVVVADVDGIVVVPRELVADVAEGVATKRRLETSARDDILAGTSIRETWRRYGVL